MTGSTQAMLALASAIAASMASSAQAAAPGPPLRQPAAALEQALVCHGDLAGSKGVPVLLVHGTGVTADQNWEPTYRPELERRGHSVCTVDLPGFAFGDVQDNVEYVVHAIREVHTRAGRKISVIGHSQGAFLPTYALRIWPDLAASVDDFVGFAGLYDRGSEAITAGCASRDGCVPSFQQLQAGSTFVTQLVRRPLPRGPSLTAIGTLRDEVVTPQPAANTIPGGRSIQLQDLCPGRQVPAGNDHIFIIGDAVAHALTLDALAHPGPADPTRIVAPPCEQLFFIGADYAAFATVTVPGLVNNGSGTNVTTEPALRCWMRLACTDAAQRGAMLTDAVITRRPGRRLRLTTQVPGRVKITVTRNGRRIGTERRTLRAGRTTVTLPRVPATGRVRVRIATRPAPFTADAVERTLVWRRAASRQGR